MIVANVWFYIYYSSWKIFYLTHKGESIPVHKKYRFKKNGCYTLIFSLLIKNKKKFRLSGIKRWLKTGKAGACPGSAIPHTSGMCSISSQI
ncbi:MAG: hypothetical protein CSB06_00220 [Bacteroidia bacterium]|nr:MAG: hypothetical protein CSB06_00220 [Bacteroidia bacterium]